MKLKTNKHLLFIICLSAISLSVLSYLFIYVNGYHLSIEDGRAHLDIARRVIDSVTPGFAQLGGIWLPIPHLLMLPLIWNDFMWHSGLAGVIPSMIAFILSAIVLCFFSKDFFKSTLAGISTFLIFITNPNLLFIQATPMTETLSILFFVLTIYLFWIWTQKKSLPYLIATGISVFLATLTRYEGWVLPATVVIGIIIIGVKRKWGKGFIEGNAIIAGTISLLGILLWIIYSFAIFNNPLNFYSGEGSANWFAQFEAQHGRLPTDGDIISTLQIYFANTLDINGLIICATAFVGFFYFLVRIKKYTFEQKVVALMLCSVIVFSLYSLFSGSSVMWSQYFYPFQTYNVRYVLLSLPFLAFISSSLVVSKKTFSILIFVILVQAVIFLKSGPLVLFKDITQTLGSSREQVAEWVKENPTEGYTLISAASNEVIIFESGQPMKKFIYEGNQELWRESLSSPFPLVSRVIMGSVMGPQSDKVYKALYNSDKLNKNYVLKYSKDNYYVYDLTTTSSKLWQVRSIDTMKSSRDEASRGIGAVNYKKELSLISELGVNYVTVDTPYDEEFYPVLKAWADEAHRLGLKVWYRGNWSGWEGWNDYPKDLTREEHLEMTNKFILDHDELFMDGDIFTPCPECEYGGPGNPLSTGDYGGYTNFMIDQYKMMQIAFMEIDKKVIFSLFSMNPDVARAVYTEDLLNETGNIITLDYFVKSSNQLVEGLEYFNRKFPNAKIVIGEFGAPIPDINGPMTEQQQALFVDEILNSVAKMEYVIGFNYWVNLHGDTALFNDNLNPRVSTKIINKYFNRAEY